MVEMGKVYRQGESMKEHDALWVLVMVGVGQESDGEGWKGCLGPLGHKGLKARLKNWDFILG